MKIWEASKRYDRKLVSFKESLVQLICCHSFQSSCYILVPTFSGGFHPWCTFSLLCLASSPVHPSPFWNIFLTSLSLSSHQCSNLIVAFKKKTVLMVWHCSSIIICNDVKLDTKEHTNPHPCLLRMKGQAFF